jgi:hypothetical protein
MQIYLRIKIKSTADFRAGKYHIPSASIIALSSTSSVSLKVGEGSWGGTFPEFSKNEFSKKRLANPGAPHPSGINRIQIRVIGVISGEIPGCCTRQGACPCSKEIVNKLCSPALAQVGVS